MAVYLCPAADANARRHFEDTILVPVDFEASPSDWSGAIAALRANHSGGSASMWGSRPGDNGRHRPKHDLMKRGDVALFYADKRFFSLGTIAVPLVNEPKARELWGSDSNGDTWELMFSFSEIMPIDLSVEAFNAALGYKSNNYIQGFDRLDDEKSAIALELIGLDDDSVSSSPAPAEFNVALALLDGPLDKQVTTAARVEQRYLRLALQGGKVKLKDSCALCGREYPTSLLVAAHIKPRSKCSEDEKKDIPAIAMLACVFGCDALFERGYIGVADGGSIVVSDSIPMAQEVSSHLVGKTCLLYDESRASYFAWHCANRFRP